jgi:hypothetical protein
VTGLINVQGSRALICNRVRAEVRVRVRFGMITVG